MQAPASEREHPNQAANRGWERLAGQAGRDDREDQEKDESLVKRGLASSH